MIPYMKNESIVVPEQQQQQQQQQKTINLIILSFNARCIIAS